MKEARRYILTASIAYYFDLCPLRPLSSRQILGVGEKQWFYWVLISILLLLVSESMKYGSLVPVQHCWNYFRKNIKCHKWKVFFCHEFFDVACTNMCNSLKDICIFMVVGDSRWLCDDAKNDIWETNLLRSALSFSPFRAINVYLEGKKCVKYVWMVEFMCRGAVHYLIWSWIMCFIEEFSQ